jgi:hypothetical protein
MDFGCGTGSSARLFVDILGVENFVGMDQSPKSLGGTRREHESECIQFLLFDEYHPVANSIWCFAMASFIIFLLWTAPQRSITFYARYDQVDCSRFGKTILGIQGLAM